MNFEANTNVATSTQKSFIKKRMKPNVKDLKKAMMMKAGKKKKKDGEGKKEAQKEKGKEE